MNEGDREKFLESFLNVYNLYGKDPNDKTTDLYFNLLSDYDLDLVISGIEQTMRSCKFFPKPAEIIENIEGKEDEHIDFAYQEAKKIIYPGFHFAKRLKNLISMQVIADMGGQQEFYNKVYVQGENDTAAYFEFKRLYKIYYRMARQGRFSPSINYLPGYMNLLPGADPIYWQDLIPLTSGDDRKQIEENKMIQIEGTNGK